MPLCDIKTSRKNLKPIVSKTGCIFLEENVCHCLTFLPKHAHRITQRPTLISLIFFEVGIPNLVCKCILGWRSVTFYY